MSKSIYFNTQWWEALNYLEQAIRDRVVSAIISYQTTGKVPAFTGGRAAFMLLKIEVDNHYRRLEKAREKRAMKKAQKPQTAPAPAPAEPAAQDNPAPADKPVDTPKAPDEKPQAAPKATRPKDISPEKKAAIGSLLQSLMQPRPSTLPKGTSANSAT